MNVVIGVTGGIAAYKVCDLINMLKRQENINVDVILTKSGAEFITPLTLQTLSKNKVNMEMFEQVDIMRPEHISLAERADLFIIYPATANIIGKIANGIADDLLSTVSMAVSNIEKCKKIVCPAMNSNMYRNIAVQDNLEKLKNKMDFDIVGPIRGKLACGYDDIGHVTKPIDVLKYIKDNVDFKIKL